MTCTLILLKLWSLWIFNIYLFHHTSESKLNILKLAILLNKVFAYQPIKGIYFSYFDHYR